MWGYGVPLLFPHVNVGISRLISLCPFMWGLTFPQVRWGLRYPTYSADTVSPGKVGWPNPSLRAELFPHIRHGWARVWAHADADADADAHLTMWS
jgi:hypothetical protein